MTRTSTIACVLLVLFGCGSAAAQDHNLRFGAKAGVNFANVNLDGEDGGATFDARLGLVGGVFVTWRALSWLEVQPEVLYTSKGAKIEETGVDSQLVLDYLELPLLARVSRRLSRSTLYAVAGPALAWRLGAKTRTEFSGSTEELDLEEDVEAFDLGIAVGGGIEVGAFVFDGRYTFGLRDIDADTTDAVTIKNRVLSVTAGFRF